MHQTNNSGKATLIIVAIVALLFINVGIFYTRRVTSQTSHNNSSTVNSQSVELNQKSLNLLRNRISIDVEAKLTPYSSGRSNPFVK